MRCTVLYWQRYSPRLAKLQPGVSIATDPITVAVMSVAVAGLMAAITICVAAIRDVFVTDHIAAIGLALPMSPVTGTCLVPAIRRATVIVPTIVSLVVGP